MKALVPFLKALPKMAVTGWNVIIGPINPSDEKFNNRTRFKLALLSFATLTIVFLISFFQAVKTLDIDRTNAFLEFAKHISYVLGAVVASYVGMESVFPSIGGTGWRGRSSGRVDDKAPAVHDSEDDAEVD